MKRIYLLLPILWLSACSQQQEPKPTDEQRLQGRLNGLFSVAKDRQVYFSQGNLQYCATAKNYRFAAKQWECVGEDNSGISLYFTRYVDLFCWGTGKYPASYGILSYMYHDFDDWGRNHISNGGNNSSIWRTMDKDEWNYLIQERPDASKLQGYATVDTMFCMVLCPDGWTPSGGISFKPGYENEGEGVRNEYTIVQAETMQQSGVVFLPFAGYRFSSGYDRLAEDITMDVTNAVNEEAYYWTASCDSTDTDAVRLIGGVGAKIELEMYYRAYGFSVRLVQNKN